mmetsp:Transcript_16191/g.20761  ORF Transcript_16191/g.20761 Transcript_16191/m.20761 type:complete len:440 (+) Transcript_16191:82-1401(+)
MSKFSSSAGQYVSAIAEAVEEYNSDLLANLLKLDADVLPGGWDFVELIKNSSKAEISRSCNFQVRQPFGEITELHLQALHDVANKNHVSAMSLQKNKFDKFLEVYKVEGSWLTPTMFTLILDTRTLAMLADAEENKDDHEHLVEAKRLFDSCFRFTIMGRATTEDGAKKRAAALFIIINQFKVYFKLGTLQLCKNLIRSVGQPNFPKFESFPMAHKVAYRFYVGRIKVLEDDMIEAEKNLTYALEHCHRSHTENIRRILEYLIPVKLILGYLPDKALLRRPELSHLEGLVTAVKQGNVRELSKELEKNQRLYISKGLYLSLDRLKILGYRNLFRSVVMIHQKDVREDSTQKATNAQRVPINMFLNPFKRFGEHDFIREQMQEKQTSSEDTEQEDLEQIKCILANLIFKGYIKGYISHQKNFLVVSANQPFPSMNSCKLF